MPEPEGSAAAIVGIAPVTPKALLRSIRADSRRPLVLSTALFVSHQFGELMVPVVAGVVIDRAVVTSDGGALVRWLAVLAVAFAGLSLSWRFADRILTRSLEQAAHGLRLRLVARVTDHQGMAAAPPVGQMVSVASSDAMAVAQTQTAVAMLVSGVAAILTAAAVLLWISVPLGLVVVLGLPPVLGALHLLGAPLEKRVAAQQADVAHAAATATDLLAGLRVLKGLRAENEASARYRAASRQSLTAGLRAKRLYACQEGLTVVVTASFVALVALVGGRLAADGSITVGQLVAAVGVTQFLVGPLGRVGWAAGVRAAARALADRVASLLTEPVATVDGREDAPAGNPALTLAQVGSRQLDGVDLAVAPGCFVGVVSPDQAAGGSLVALLARAVDPDRGSLALGGRPLDRIRLDALRRQLLVAGHDAALFTGTVRENLMDGRGSASGDGNGRGPGPGDGRGDGDGDGDGDGGLAGAIAASAADEFIDSLPAGFDTTLTERGQSLSGGQRQRLALARAVAAEPPVLVLHEPTTAVDAVTEARIAVGLRAHRTGRTTVVITTSPALLAAADVVVLLEGGKVVDSGSHAELVARNPRYAEVVLA